MNADRLTFPHSSDKHDLGKRRYSNLTERAPRNVPHGLIYQRRRHMCIC
jgi:hypothetical protein